MRNHLMLLLTLSTLLAYRPGHAQARADGLGESSPTLVASTRTKPAATHTVPEAASAKATGTTRKDVVVTKKSQNPINRIWSRIMGYCHEVHTASQKKS